MLPHWRRLSFTLRWRGARLGVAIEPERFVVLADESQPPLKISLEGGAGILVHPGRQYAAKRTARGWSEWREVHR
jgi:trehalose/maltose hydrolase-like predicted phosphorylase